MKRFSRLVAVGLGFALGTVAAVTPALAQDKTSAPPPIIDRQLLFDAPELSGAQISPDGKFIAFLKPFKGTQNVWVKRTEEAFDKARPVTADTSRPIRQYFWSRDGKFLLFAQDKGGDENFNIYAVNPNDAVPAGQEVPPARDLTNLKGVQVQIIDVPEFDPNLMFIGLNDRDQSWHDLYKLNIATGERTLIRKNTDKISGWQFDLNGNLRLAVRITDAGDTEILRVDADGFKKLFSCSVFEEANPVRFHKDGKRFYLVTNQGDSDLTRLALLDSETGKEEPVESDPLKRVDFGGPIFSEISDDLVATTYNDDRTRVYWRDKSYESDYKFLQQKFPGKDISLGSGTKDEQTWLLSLSSDTEPGERWLFERKTKKLTFQYRTREKLVREHLATMEAIRYPSSDGLEIPAFLTLPKGVQAKNLPLIVFPHGGPWARDEWGFDPYAQFLANRGYAVLQPNFRSSTGYGKKFLNAGNKKWGETMQDDLTWGVKHLVSKGIVDPKRVGIMGGSYGGYATLAGVAFTPDVYAAAVAIVAPSNLITLLESIPPYWEAGRIIFHTRMGDPNTAEGKAQLQRQSPLNFAEKIKTPLMVVQGANDPRVNKRESDQIVVALRDRGFPVEYICAPDEGHGFARPVNNMAMLAAAEKFLAKHLNGRFQENATPDVSKRLGEITVDVKSVKVAQPATGAMLPTPETDLSPLTLGYTGKLEAGGQSYPLEITLEIKDSPDGWAVSENAKLPIGVISDQVTLSKGSLIARNRSVRQGAITVDLTFQGNKANGRMMMGSQSRPIEAETGGPIFADGAGSYVVLGRLPLAPGYAVNFRNFDLQTQKASVRQLKVVGVESVTVAAGTFETFRVEITDEKGPQKTVLWIAKEGRKPVKITSEGGGPVITVELSK
jgi:dipeptidyl aminopeptidase/acylaminoacyl peptidase